MTEDLSILCVTKNEAHASNFLLEMSALAHYLSAEFVVALDAEYHASIPADRVIFVKSKGYVESVLDEAVSACNGRWILRLDDDELCSPAMTHWLNDGLFAESDHWQFPRIHLWNDTRTAIMTPVLFPDHQTRLSSREKSGGRYGVHAGSPFGGGTIAPVAIMHHKFIVRSLKARLQIARTYDKFSPGYGTGQMIPFQAPEIAYFGQEITLCDAGTGMVPWTPMWSQQENIHEVTVIK